jgi:hypothetical protein
MIIFGLQLQDISFWLTLTLLVIGAVWSFNGLKVNLKRVLDTQKQMQLKQDRTELLLLIFTRPWEGRYIIELYSNYKSNGHNSYIDDVYGTWHEKYSNNEYPKI